MAETLAQLRGILVDRLVNSFDRRIPAVLEEIDMTVDGEMDIIREVYLTAGYWNVLLASNSELHARPEVHRVKAATPVRYG